MKVEHHAGEYYVTINGTTTVLSSTVAKMLATELRYHVDDEEWERMFTACPTCRELLGPLGSCSCCQIDVSDEFCAAE